MRLSWFQIRFSVIGDFNYGTGNCVLSARRKCRQASDIRSEHVLVSDVIVVLLLLIDTVKCVRGDKNLVAIERPFFFNHEPE